MLSALFFYLFAAVLLGAAFMVVAARNPVHAVLFLILAFFNAAGLFVLLGAEFLAMILIVVYVGAVLVLFLFVVMMLDVDFAELRAGFIKYLPIGATIGLLLLVELVFVLGAWVTAPDIEASAPAPPPDIASNTEALGLILYTRYVYLFEAAGLILLVAMIGAIVLTLHHKRDVRRQRISAQVGRTREESVELVEVETGEGAVVTVGLTHYLTVAAILFTLGIFGIFLNRKNVIVILMSIELMLLAVNLNLVAFSAYHGDLVGQVFAMIVLTVAAAEAAIGLAIVVVYFRNRGTIDVAEIDLLKG